MSYLIAKTLHLLCVFAWFAGLTYLPRLLVAAAAVEPQAHAERQRLLQLASSLCRFTLIVTAPPSNAGTTATVCGRKSSPTVIRKPTGKSARVSPSFSRSTFTLMRSG